MIKLLPRYIANSIFYATGMVTLVITSILFIMLLLGEAKSIGEGDYQLIQSLVYVLLHLPNELYHFSPLLILLGSMIGLSLLSSHRELAVMRSCGFSIRRIIWSVLSAAFCLIIAVSVIGEKIGPSLSYKAVIHKENAKNAGQAVVTATGIWFHINNNFLHIQRVVGRQLLDGVTRYQFDEQHHLQAAYYAKTLLLKDGQWQMQDVVKTTFYHERTKSQSFAEIPLDLKLNANLLKVDLVDPNEMSLSKLIKFSRYLEKNGLQANEYRFNFWQRIFQPLASLVMVFLAIPFVLSVFNTTSMGWRIILGVMAGIAFFILNALLSELCVVYQIPPLFAALFPSVLFAVVGFILFRWLFR
jgi:lipopolysaccharide export system permease protein